MGSILWGLLSWGSRGGSSYKPPDYTPLVNEMKRQFNATTQIQAQAQEKALAEQEKIIHMQMQHAERLALRQELRQEGGDAALADVMQGGQFLLNWNKAVNGRALNQAKAEAGLAPDQGFEIQEASQAMNQNLFPQYDPMLIDDEADQVEQETAALMQVASSAQDSVDAAAIVGELERQGHRKKEQA